MNAFRFVITLAGAMLACSAMAQQAYDQPAPATASAHYASNPSDPPARVARLSYLHGAVSFAPAGENDWVEAQLNRPLVTGDKLWTDAGGRAELDIGASTIRVDESSNFDFLELGDQTAQMELTQGALNLSVRRVRNNESYEIDTPTLAFVADRVGDYRIDVDAQGATTTVTARRGGGEIYGEGGTRVSIAEGQALTFDNAQLRDYRSARVADGDAFDGFVNTRDQRYERSTSRNYVSQDVVGYEDLDDNGRWSDVPDYGHVWYPNDVASDWAPYHDGHWAWVEPWGWTWVDDAPWGFAPFHYGRWVYADTRWGWVPGPLESRPVYAPALVAFVGGGVGVNVSIGGPIGWFALGPRDVYFPGYRCGPDYFARLNVSNARLSYASVNNYYGGFARGNINYAQINYANRNRPGALAAMPANAFASGRAVATSDLTMNSRAALANARIMPRATVAPTRASVLAGNGRGGRAVPPAGALHRQVVAARTPPAAPASFAQRQRLLQRTPGQPLTTTQLRSLAAQHGPRDARVRAISNARPGAPNAQPAMARNTPEAARDRGTVRAPGSGNVRGNEHGLRDANRAANLQGAPLRSSDYARGPRERAAARMQDRTVQRGNAAQVRNRVQADAASRQSGSRQTLRSSEFARARDMNAHANRGSASPARTAHVERAQQRVAPPRTHERVVRAPPQQVERASVSRNRGMAMAQHPARDENRPARAQERAVAMPQQHARNPQVMRSVERSAAPARAPENRMAQRAPRNAPAPSYQRAERMPAQTAARTPAPQQRFTPPPAAPQRQAAPQQQRMATAQRQNRQPPANAKKDKNERGRD